jgi:hypothetical protein
MKRAMVASTQPIDVPMSEATPAPFLRRVLLKTKPVPYPIWMASLATIATGPIVLLVWAAHPTVPVRAILLIQLLLVCVGGLMGLFAARMLKLPWFASFGEVLEKGGRPVPQDEKIKPPIALLFGFGLALMALVVVSRILL